MKDRLLLLLLGNRLPRLILALFSLGVLAYILISRLTPALLAPATDQFSNISWTATSISFDYQAAKDCPSLTFHISYRDASNNALDSGHNFVGSPKSGGVHYRETLTLSPGTTVPSGTSQIVITSSCAYAPAASS